jgi:hypothetical protein
MLKELRQVYIFNAVLRLDHWPTSLKGVQTFMIPKSGKYPPDVSSYRPISLLPIISKLLEKQILKTIHKEESARLDSKPPIRIHNKQSSGILSVLHSSLSGR